MPKLAGNSSSSSIYLDNNATTRLDPEVFEAMRPYLLEQAGNASSRHQVGRMAHRALDRARRQIAAPLGAAPEEIYFTSGATEANNLALLGAVTQPERRILINPAEHPSCIAPVSFLESQGHSLQRMTLNEEGLVDPQHYPGESFDLVVLQLANSETGAIQPVQAFRGQFPDSIHFHCDAVQGVGKIPVDFRALGVSTLSLSGHKLHGPGGIGALIVRSGTKLRPLLYGGHQQKEIRPGTEPIAAIVGLAAAVDLAARRIEANEQKNAALRDRLEGKILAVVPDVVRNGPPSGRLPNTTNLSFLGATAEAMVIALDLAGVCCSAGTACASGSLEPSMVLRAMGIEGDRLHGAVRFSVGRFQTEEEIDEAVARIAVVVETVRKSLPAGRGGSA